MRYGTSTFVVPGIDWAFRFILSRLSKLKLVPGHTTITRSKLLPPQPNSISPWPLTRIQSHHFFRLDQLITFIVP
jgi:hypothetical protein